MGGQGPRMTGSCGGSYVQTPGWLPCAGSRGGSRVQGPGVAPMCRARDGSCRLELGPGCTSAHGFLIFWPYGKLCSLFLHMNLGNGLQLCCSSSLL